MFFLLSCKRWVVNINYDLKHFPFSPISQPLSQDRHKWHTRSIQSYPNCHKFWEIQNKKIKKYCHEFCWEPMWKFCSQQIREKFQIVQEKILPWSSHQSQKYCERFNLWMNTWTQGISCYLGNHPHLTSVDTYDLIIHTTLKNDLML